MAAAAAGGGLAGAASAPALAATDRVIATKFVGDATTVPHDRFSDRTKSCLLAFPHALHTMQ